MPPFEKQKVYKDVFRRHPFEYLLDGRQEGDRKYEITPAANMLDRDLSIVCLKERWDDICHVEQNRGYKCAKHA